MCPTPIHERFRDLQQYVNWNDEEESLVRSLGGLVAPAFPALVDDFYAEIDRHEETRRVITGGPAQIERLKGQLIRWLTELFEGPHDAAYVDRRWRVGYRHVEIGLPQVYTNVAISRLRRGLTEALRERWSAAPGDSAQLFQAIRALNMLIDLDLAIIEDAYQAESLARHQRIERLATLGQVAGGIAHELRNPLNVMKTSAYYLLHGRNPTPEKLKEHLQRIERQIELSNKVITALSNFAKQPTPSLQLVPVARLIEDTLEANPVPRGVDTQVEVKLTTPVSIDMDQMLIVLGNLIRNACEAMPNGGTLRIGVETVGTKVRLQVSDNGQGMTPEQLGRVMEPLYSTKARGLGLGLAIARSIVDKHGGQLTVASEAHQGTTFTVELPAPDSDTLSQFEDRARP